MFKKVTIISIIFVMTLTLITGAPAYARTKAEVKQDLATSQQKEKDAKSEYESKKATEAEIAAEIKGLEQSITKTENDLIALESKIADNNDKIEATKVEIAAMEANVQQQNEDLSARLRMMYESGDGTLVEVLLGSESINDFLGGLDIVKKIHAYDMEVLDDLNRQLDAIEKKKAELDDMKSLLKTHQDSQIQKREALASDKKKLVVAKAKAHDETQQALEDLELAQRESDALEAQLKTYQSSQTWTGAQSGNGRLGYPCHGTITSEYGPRVNPVSGVWKKHDGMDIAVPMGTPIHAAEAGVVYMASWYGGYGNCVIVDHGGGIMTLYGHNSSYAASVGQKVTRGQVIAYAGSTGNSTGPHCHFEVRVKGSTQNPRGWL